LEAWAEVGVVLGVVFSFREGECSCRIDRASLVRNGMAFNVCSFVSAAVNVLFMRLLLCDVPMMCRFRLNCLRRREASCRRRTDALDPIKIVVSSWAEHANSELSLSLDEPTVEHRAFFLERRRRFYYFRLRIARIFFAETDFRESFHFAGP
jgi:hypothetical protein